MIRLRQISIIFLALFSYGAEASGITYHGRLLNPDNTPVTDSSVQFKMDILTPDSQNCLMYEELQTKNLSLTSGDFAITINDGTGTRTDSSGYGFDNVFANIATFTFNPATCASGTGSYTPTTGDGRTFQVFFKTSTMSSWEPIPPQSINFSPFAIEAKQVSGFPASSLLRVQQASGQPGTATALSPTDFTNLQTLLAGTSTQYVQSGTSGAPIPSFSSNPGSASAGDIWFNSTSKTLDYYDGTSVQTVGTGTSSGTVTSVATGTGLTGGPITTSGTISLASVGTAGTYTKVVTDAYGRVTSGSQITGNDITSGTIGGTTAMNTSGSVQTSSDVTSRREFLYDHSGAGPGYVGLQAPSTVTTNYTLTWPTAPAGSNGQVLVSDTSGNLTWLSPTGGTVTNIATGTGLTGGPISGSGTISLANPTLASIGGVEAVNAAAHEWINSISTSGVPALSQPAFSDISGTANLTSQVTGILPVANGGTGASTLTGAGIFLNGGNSFGAAATLGTGDANTLSFNTNGSSRMTIDTAGNVGIGTTSPISPFDVEGTITQGAASTYYFANHTLFDVAPSSASSSNGYWGSFTRLTSSSDNIASQDLHGNDNSIQLYSPATTTVNSAVAESGQVAQYSGRTLSYGIGGSFSVLINSSGAITNAYGVQAGVTQTAGIITNAYGVDIGSVQGSNKWSLYASDSTAPSYFAGNVGIGTTTPGGTLDVEGGTSASADGSSITIASQSGAAGGHNGGNVVILPGAATGAGQGGRFVVGSATPHWFANVLADFVGSSSQPSSRVVSEQRGAGASAGYPGFMAMNYMDTAASGEPQMILQNSRGTYALPTPVQAGDSIGRLVFSGVYDTSGDPNEGSTIEAMADENWSATANGSDLIFNTTSDGTTSDSERMRITAGGNVGIGTTSPSANLDIYSSGTTTADIRNGSYTGTLAMNTNGNFYVYNGSAGVYLTSGATSWTANSDRRLKTNIKTLPVLDRLANFRAVTFNWKENGKKDYGVIAQELYKSFPEAVKKGSDDPNEKIKSIGDPHVWGVQYDKLGAMALEGVKELKAIVDKIESKVSALEKRSDQLFARSDEQKREIQSIRDENRRLETENAELKAAVCQLNSKATICSKTTR